MSVARPGPVPSQVSLASTLLLALGAILALTGVLIFAVRGRIADSLDSTASVTPTDPAAVATSLALVASVFVGVGALAIIAGALIRRRIPWARWLGVAIGVLLGVLGVQYLVAGVGSLLALLIPVGALGVAVTVVSALLSTPAAAWFRGEPA